MRSAVLSFIASLSLTALYACGSDTSSGTTSSSSGAGGTSASTSGSGGSGGATTSTGTGGTGGSTTGTGGSDAGSDAPSSSCTGDLSNISSGDFQISFSILTTQTTDIAVLNQRSMCGSGDFWDVRVVGGTVSLETDAVIDGSADDASITGCTLVNDGLTHQVVLQRINGVLTLYVDGFVDATGVNSTASWGSLAALATGTDVCVGSDGTMDLDTSLGKVLSACVSTTTVAQEDAGTSMGTGCE